MVELLAGLYLHPSQFHFGKWNIYLVESRMVELLTWLYLGTWTPWAIAENKLYCVTLEKLDKFYLHMIGIVGNFKKQIIWDLKVGQVPVCQMLFHCVQCNRRHHVSQGLLI